MNYHITVSLLFADGAQIALRGGQLIEVSYSENAMDSTLSMNPGICEQNASVKFYDYKKVVINRFNTESITEATILIEERDENEAVINTCTYYSADYDIDNDNSIVEIQCKDNTKIISEVVVPKSPAIADMTAAQLLDEFFNYLPTDYQWRYFDSETRIRCEGIVVPHAWHGEDTLENFLVKICTLALLRIYWKNNVFYVMRCV